MQSSRNSEEPGNAGYNAGVNTLSQPLTHWISEVLAAPASSLAITPLAAEASFRHFYRIDTGSVTRIVMDSPPQKENNEQFCHLARVFGDAGVPVPQVLAADPGHGFYLLTDLGQRDLEAAYQQGDRDSALAAAISALVVLQRVDDPAIVPYTPQRFFDELGIFTQWFLQEMLECEPPSALQGCFDALVEQTRQQPQCCVHRDYHCRNLLFSSDGTLGIVDFQDALHGPAAYDLASLLRDCYYELPEDQINRWCDYYLQLRESAEGRSYAADRFRRDLDFCAVQRQLKAIGIFARLQRRDGKASHLRYISPLLQRLVRLCRDYPELSVLGDFLTQLQPRATSWQA